MSEPIDRNGQNQRKRARSQASHYHCYLLRSLDPKHPRKTYVGFTTNPCRRLRQHNGELKNGGAWRTRRAGRPWAFVVIVHGFPDQKTALSMEWMWQHVARSTHIRNDVGESDIRSMARTYSVKGKLTILKTILAQCTKFFAYKFNLFFFKEQDKGQFEKIAVEGEHCLRSRVSCSVVSSYEDMPFWEERNKKRTREKDLVVASPIPSDDPVRSCGICQRTVVQELHCLGCSKDFHELCVELHTKHRGKCPSCFSSVNWNICSDSCSDQDNENLSICGFMDSGGENDCFGPRYTGIDEGKSLSDSIPGDQAERFVDLVSSQGASRLSDESVYSFARASGVNADKADSTCHPLLNSCPRPDPLQNRTLVCIDLTSDSEDSCPGSTVGND